MQLPRRYFGCLPGRAHTQLFINGLTSPSIRQRLLETDNINSESASQLAESLEQAHMRASSMGQNTTTPLVASILQRNISEKLVSL